LLMELVDEAGTVQKQIARAARDLGITEHTLERAKGEMGIESKSAAGGGFQYWLWVWPVQAQAAFTERGARNMDLTARYLQERQTD